MKIRPIFLAAALFTAAAPFASLPAHAGEAELKVGDLTLKYDDEKWEVQEKPRQMVAAILTVKEGEAKGLEATIYHFGKGQGGDMKANIQRWIGQFEGEPKVDGEELKFGEGDSAASLYLTEMKGTYKDGPFFGPKTPKPDWTMLGAILESAGGDVFVKMPGPDASVASVKDAFRAVCASAFGGLDKAKAAPSKGASKGSDGEEAKGKDGAAGEGEAEKEEAK